MDKWRADRNNSLMELDMEYARKIMPGASSDHVRLMAMHKVRYECIDLDRAARHASGEWLHQNGYGRMDGGPLLPEGELPAGTTPNVK